jgi:hypothetical protein
MFVLLETFLQIPQFPATRPCFFRLSVQCAAGTRLFMKRMGVRVSTQQVLAHFCTLPPAVGAFLYSSSIRWRIFVPFLHPLAHVCTLPPSVGAFLFTTSFCWRIFVPFLHPLAHFLYPSSIRWRILKSPSSNSTEFLAYTVHTKHIQY